MTDPLRERVNAAYDTVFEAIQERTITRDFGDRLLGEIAAIHSALASPATAPAELDVDDLADTLCYLRRHPHTVDQPHCTDSRYEASSVVVALDARSKSRIAPLAPDSAPGARCEHLDAELNADPA